MDEKVPEFSTKMMQQYMDIKKRYPDCIIFFRLGDFYEMFREDARIGAEILGITLTSRSRGKDGRVPMAGIPYHALDTYLARMVNAGNKVAICEQLTQPGGKDIVVRDVVRVVTPGTLMEDPTLERKENSFLVAITGYQTGFGIAAADITTGSLYTNELQNKRELQDEIAKLNPKECIIPSELFANHEFIKFLEKQGEFKIYETRNALSAKDAEKNLLHHFGLRSTESIGLNDKKLAIDATALILAYLKYTQSAKIPHIKTIKVGNSKSFVELDRATIVNLELMQTIRGGERVGSLIHHLDRTKTSMGGRLLRAWLLKPLLNINDIAKRVSIVEYFVKNRRERDVNREKLREVMDIERLVAKIAVGLGSPRDLVNLGNSMEVAQKILNNLNHDDIKRNLGLKQELELEKLAKQIQTTLVSEPAIDPKQGGIIRKGVNAKLDELIETVEKSKDWLAQLEKEEKEKTKITTLKVRYNKIFGYYIEVSKSYLNLVPSNYIRKQTLVNGERYVTLELKEQEELILNAEEKRCELEYEVFTKLTQITLEKILQIQKLALNIATLDCLLTFAEIAETENYCQPQITTDTLIEIKNGRHPVVETLLEDKQFVPNDTVCDNKDTQLTIITGPNMAGKSVYIRQVAQITLLAQIGSFVPAESAKIGIVDKIFVRSGASDIITSGLSTFMVEMVETANILNSATQRSLIIMDEIGRGTSTYDGISIAWALAEYLVSDIHAKTLFATHYHELETLEKRHKDKVKNMQMAVVHNDGNPVFLHKVVPGGAEHSFGIYVANLAGIPEKVTNRAKIILSELEKKNNAK